MAKAVTKPVEKNKATSSNKEHYIWAIGRRKKAVARVRLYEKTTKDSAVDILVNDLPIGQYFKGPVSKLHYAKPLSLTNTLDKFRVTVKVDGSGMTSQIDAIKHGIARALVKADASHRPTLKTAGLLTRDARKKQKRMIGHGGKSRAKKQSPKR